MERNITEDEYDEYKETEYYEKFHAYFGKELLAYKFIDAEMLEGTGEIKLDVTKFNKFLHTKFGEYEDERGLSTSQLVIREYGQAVYNWVKSVT